MSDTINYVLIFFVAFALSWLLSPLTKRLAFIVGAVDKPKARGVNKRLLPRLGGAAIYASFVSTILIFLRRPDFDMWGIIIGATIIMLVGVIDDIYTLKPRVKLLGQILAAAVLPLYGVQANWFTNPFGGMIYLGHWSIPLTIFWVVAICNAINFIDGLDGLAAGISSIAAITLLVVAIGQGQVPIIILTLILTGSTLGFLPYNINPAKMIMGDSGAMFLGYMLAAVSVQGTMKSATALAVFIPLVALGLPIMDTTIVVIKRLFNHRRFYEADRNHLHHRLLDMGLTQKQAVAVLYSVSGFCGASALVLTETKPISGLLLVAGLVLALFFVGRKSGLITMSMHESGSTTSANQ
ncbi:MAG: glycosyltransferase family 4 protein [Chloroflexota bacterium]